MKRILVALFAVALAVVVSACSSGGSLEGLALGAAPWQDGEKASYDVVDTKGNNLGPSDITFARNGDAWVLTQVDKLTGLEQSMKVRIDAQTLRPLGEEKTIRAQGTDATVSTTYKDGKLSITAVVNGQNKSAAIDVPATALENDQLLMTLRALPFAEGYEGTYTNVVGQNAAKIKTTVRVKGQETVQVPAGSFSAWRVELDFGQAKQSAWYQVEAPHQMVKYDNGATQMVLVQR